MKIAKTITEIYAEIEKCQLNLNSYDNSQMDKWKWLNRKQAFETTLEIIKSNM